MKVEGVWGSYKQGYTFNYIPKSQTWRDKGLGEGGSGDGGGVCGGFKQLKKQGFSLWTVFQAAFRHLTVLQERLALILPQ